MQNALTHRAALSTLSIAIDQSDGAGLSLTIAICDAGGHLVALLRGQDALLASLESAQTKARTAVYFGVETRHLPSDKPIVPALLGAVSYPLAMLPGGVPIRQGSRIVGAVGVGGGTPEQDQATALLAANAMSEQLSSSE